MASKIVIKVGRSKRSRKLSGITQALAILMADECSETLTVVVLTANMNIYVEPTLDPSTIAPLGTVTVKYAEIKNIGNVADTPHYKIIVDDSVAYDDDDPSGSLAAGVSRVKSWDFCAPEYEDTYTVTLKVWGKNTESEPA